MKKQSNALQAVPVYGVSDSQARVLLAAFDTEVSEDTWGALLAEQTDAKDLYQERKADHCPEWLGACIRPFGAKGGYTFLIKRADMWSIKLLRGVPNRPAIGVEMRAYYLHTHPLGAEGA
jgi:hypothetical protein